MSSKESRTALFFMKLKNNIHFVSQIELASGSRTSTFEILREGIIRDRGFVVTRKMLEGFVENFKEGTYGQDLRISLGHVDGSDDEAAAWFKDVFIQGISLMATVEWTDLGVQKLEAKRYRYVSAELAMKYTEPKQGKIVSNVLTGAALTNSPALKNQQPIELSEEETNLIQNTFMLKKYIKDLKARKSLSEEDVKLARTLLADASEDEQAELSEEVDALEKAQKLAAKKAAKPVKTTGDDGKETDEYAEENEGEEEDDEKKKDGGKKKMSAKKSEVVSLAEFETVKQELTDMRLREARTILSQTVRESLLLSEKKGESTGFREEQLSEVVEFMSSLTKAQQETFTTLMGKVTSVDFSRKGGAGRSMTGDKDSQVVTLAEEIFATKFPKGDGNAEDFAQCQREAYKRVNA